MKNKVHETIIIGAGISGLACARQLHDARRDFLVISKDIGGRMGSLDSPVLDYNVEYTDGDCQILKYAEKIERFDISDFYYLNDGKYRNLFTYKNIKRIPKIIKLLSITRRLRNHIFKYRKEAPHKSTKELFENDPFLLKYWKMPAKDFIKKHGFEELDEIYVNPVSLGTLFVESKKLNALYYMWTMFVAISKTWVVNLKSIIRELSRGYEDKIKIGIVTTVCKNENGTFTIHSSVGDFIAKNIVFAAPQKTLAEVYNLPKPYLQPSIHVFFVRGIRKDIYQNMRNIVFQQKDHDISFIWKQKNGIEIIYSKENKPNFKKYYKEYRIVTEVNWNPAMVIPKHNLIEQKLDENMYLASDYNMSSAEDAFLTGLYAANQIIKGR